MNSQGKRRRGSQQPINNNTQEEQPLDATQTTAQNTNKETTKPTNNKRSSSPKPQFNKPKLKNKLNNQQFRNSNLNIAKKFTYSFINVSFKTIILLFIIDLFSIFFWLIFDLTSPILMPILIILILILISYLIFFCTPYPTKMKFLNFMEKYTNSLKLKAPKNQKSILSTNKRRLKKIVSIIFTAIFITICFYLVAYVIALHYFTLTYNATNLSFRILNPTIYANYLTIVAIIYGATLLEEVTKIISRHSLIANIFAIIANLASLFFIFSLKLNPQLVDSSLTTILSYHHYLSLGLLLSYLLIIFLLIAMIIYQIIMIFRNLFN